MATLVATTIDASEARGAEVVEMGNGGLRAGLRVLAERGLFDVLCEGGPGLTGARLAEGLAERLTVFVAPLLVGRGAPDLVAAPAVSSTTPRNSNSCSPRRMACVVLRRSSQAL